MEKNKKIRTRFAPSPTGYLHIGSLRTALFNWLYARANGGEFFLRIEDTDLERSFDAATDNIFETLSWMGLNYDGDYVIQSKNRNRHVEVAHEMLKKGTAYKCYCTKERLEELRNNAENEKRAFLYDRHCLHLKEQPVDGTPFVIRLKADTSGATTVHDLVQGDVKVKNSQMDDLILLRSDGSPTYMLSVVVDDHDMGITHVIRGDDHLTNTFRQIQIYKAMGWDIPEFAHIPLIYNNKGKKLSKREGTVNLHEYQDIFLPDALFNALLRLGWSHGNDEIISREDAVRWFDISHVGRSPARFDLKKLESTNAHYIRALSPEDAVKLVVDHLHKEFDHDRLKLLALGIASLQKRAKTISELVKPSYDIYLTDKIIMDDSAINYLDNADLSFMEYLIDDINKIESWTEKDICEVVRSYAEKSGMKLVDVAQPLRCLLTGATVSPSVFEIMAIIGRKESIDKIMLFKNF